MAKRTVIRVSELKLRIDHTREELEEELCRRLHLKKQPLTYEIMRQSIDARRKPELFYVYTVDVLAPAVGAKHLKKSKKAVLTEREEYEFPFRRGAADLYCSRPVVVGSGPAGLFCALMLARAGLRPVVLERGEPVEKRAETVRTFWETGKLDPGSNVQFGEGGAGTFSDGKLNTLVKDPEGRIRFVLKEFVRAGADPAIQYQQKPHIGTDVLMSVVKHIRCEIEELGGEFCFESCLTDIRPLQGSSQTDIRLLQESSQTDIRPLRESGQTDIRPLQGSSLTDTQSLQGSAEPGGAGNFSRWRLEINGGDQVLDADSVVLAIGHSARDTFEMLHRNHFQMQPKAFAVGLRMEHPQAWINRAMYGEGAPEWLGAAPYKVTHKCADGRGVYSFCMCPGGYVVNASSEPGRLAVNGMSYSDRGSRNANSAIVVTVSPEDYHAETPLSGIAFQRRLEEAAFASGGGKIPVQRFGDFCREDTDAASTAEKMPDRKEKNAAGPYQDTETAKSQEAGLDAVKGAHPEFDTFLPQMRGQYVFSDVRSVLPETLNQALIEGIHAFGRQIPGFDSPDAILSAVESRTSSPVRILRGEDGQALSFEGIFPCGEGAGYAGGITSAAVDGIRVAENLCRKMLQNHRN